MKTYLTSKEFADLFFKLHEEKMSRNYTSSTTDRIIYDMFCQYEKDVKETLEGAMWDIDQYEGEDASHSIGYQFHKSFRQTDVIPAKHIDGILWSCMQDAEVFWKTMEKACKILQSKDAAELYKEEI
jgi:hypothetical protein